MSGILVIDDEVVITTQLKETLERMGYVVAGIGYSGEEAIAKAEELRPDLIIMDIVMKNSGIDGITAAERIKNTWDIPVIFLTAFGNEQILERAKFVNPYGFINKPFTERELKTAIELALFRIEKEKELKRSEETYRSVVVTAVEAIVIIDIHMNIVFWNKAAESMFGYKEEEIIRKPFTTLIPDRLRSQLSVEMDRMVLTEESNPVARTTETIGLRKDRTEFPLEFSLSSWIVRDEIYFTISARDITERKKIEQMKTDFVSLVSHQLKTPVAGILGCIDNLLAGFAGPLTPEQIEYLTAMKEISLRNYRNINDLLNVSRLERGIVEANIKPHSLKKIVAGVLRAHKSLLEEKGLKWRLTGWKENYEILADRDKLFEAVSNVIHNAIKFTEQGTISVRLQKENGNAHIEIEDTGSGIPYDIQPYLFKKGMILRGAPDAQRGSGLGLYIAKEFMKLQNGDVQFVPRRGKKGSRFVFQIPLIKSQSNGR